MTPDEALQEYAPICKWAARKWFVGGDDFDELEQRSLIALWEATAKSEHLDCPPLFKAYAIQRMEWAIRKYHYQRRLDQANVPLDTPIGDSGFTIEDVLPSLAAPPDEDVERLAIRQWVRDAVDALPPRERTVMLGDALLRTEGEIAAKIGCRRSEIAKLRHVALFTLIAASELRQWEAAS